MYGCADCTQAAWCGLQLQSITGKDPTYGISLRLYGTPGISDMCGVKNVKGALTGGFSVLTMKGLVSLDGAEGIASVGVSSGGGFNIGTSILLQTNPILTSAIALANTEYTAGTPTITGIPSPALPSEPISSSSAPSSDFCSGTPFLCAAEARLR